MKHKSTKACKTGKGKSSEQTPVKQQQPTQPQPPQQTHQQPQQQQQQYQSIDSSTLSDDQSTGTLDNQQQHTSSSNQNSGQNETSEATSATAATNQNILEAAAKNTIFRDSFISMANHPAEGLEKPPVDEEGVGYNNEFWSKDKQQSDVILSPQDLVEPEKKSMFSCFIIMLFFWFRLLSKSVES